MDSLKLDIHETISTAPNYSAPDYKRVNLRSAVVVMNGTVSGKPTVDLVLADEHGQEYVAVVKASHLNCIQGVINANRGQG